MIFITLKSDAIPSEGWYPVVSCSTPVVLRIPCVYRGASMSDILLDTQVSDEDVATIAVHYLTTWEELTPYLGLTHTQEVEIRNTFRGYGDQKREALHKWKQFKGKDATYRAFIAAATEASNKDLVDKVEAMLRKRGKSTGKFVIRYWSPPKSVPRTVHGRKLGPPGPTTAENMVPLGPCMAPQTVPPCR